MSAVGGDPGSPAGQIARVGAAIAQPRGAATLRTLADAGGLGLPLELVRSYEIPVDDPSYRRLLDWSWTYDSAVAAAAFAATGDEKNAGQLLDQLAALQYDDGSLEIAFNTATGEGAQVFRSGTVAWLGLAAVSFQDAFGTDRYRKTEQRAAEYLLTLQSVDGLVRGGPDVKWISTQHNLIAYSFLARLADELARAGDEPGAARYREAAARIAKAIEARLLVVDGSGVRFRRGLDDDTQAVDVQALGAMFLVATGQPDLAKLVLDDAQRTFALEDRSIRLSSEEDTFNLSFEAAGPFTGYAPYAGKGAPDVLWAEASGEMRMATAALGLDTSALDKGIEVWASTTKERGALQADRTVGGGASGDIEYHVWPASTATAWTVLAQNAAPTFFAAAR